MGGKCVCWTADVGNSPIGCVVKPIQTDTKLGRNGRQTQVWEEDSPGYGNPYIWGHVRVSS